MRFLQCYFKELIFSVSASLDIKEPIVSSRFSPLVIRVKGIALPSHVSKFLLKKSWERFPKLNKIILFFNPDFSAKSVTFVQFCGSSKFMKVNFTFSFFISAIFS